MQSNFQGEWGLILGGSSGFGLATVRKLASSGMNVALLYRETAVTERKLKNELASLASEKGVTILPLNRNALDEAARTETIRELTDRNIRVRVLLHSIARGNLKPLAGTDHLTKEDVILTGYAMGGSMLDWTRDLHAAGLFLPSASVIGLSSEGTEKYWEGYGAVSMAKAALKSLSAYMAVEFGASGIRTNIIQAGVTGTSSMKRIPGSAELLEATATRNPLGRSTTPEDVADAVYLLCLPEARWINGAVIHVDGGEHCR